MARRRIEEEKQRLRQRQKDAVMGFVSQVRFRERVVFLEAVWIVEVYHQHE